MFNLDSLLKNLKKDIKNNQGIVEGIFLSNGFRAFKLVLGLITTYIVVRYFSPETYGQYNFVLTIIAALSIFSLPGINNVVAQSTARGFIGTFRVSISKTVIFSLIATALLFAGAVYYLFLKENEVMALSFCIAGILFPVANGLCQWKAVYLGSEKFRYLALTGAVNAVFRTVLMVATSILYPGNIIYLLIAFLTPAVFQNLFQTMKLWSQTSKTDKAEKDSIDYGMKTSLYAVATAISSNIDNLLLYMFLSPAALAVFVVAKKVPEMLKLLIQGIAKVLSPKFSKQVVFTKKMDKFFKLFSVVVAVGTIAMAFTIYPFCFVLFFGEQYKGALFYSQLLLCTVAIVNSAPLKFWFISSRLDKKNNKKIVLAMSLSRIIFSLLLIPFFGIAGAIASTFFHRVISSFYIHWLMAKTYPAMDN